MAMMTGGSVTKRRAGLWVVFMGTVVIWCHPRPTFSQEKPDFGHLDAGGMPTCLIELTPQVKSSGWIMNSGQPYAVWAAPKKAGEQYYAAAWRSFGPFTLARQQRYIFNWDGASHGGRLATNPERTVTTPILSPAFASLHAQNFDGINVWLIPNPPPPGCGGENVGTHPEATALSGAWTAHIPARNWSHSGYQIIQNGQDLTYMIYSGERHTGRVQGNGTISYVQANVTGKVSSNGKQIDWSNGTYWTKDSQPEAMPKESQPGAIPLSGTWTAFIPAKNWSHGGYQIIQNGQDLTYLIFSGERHTGRVLSDGTISYVQANVTGKVSNSGKRIDWSNGTYWTKDIVTRTDSGKF
jgi:hypothetical protein